MKRPLDPVFLFTLLFTFFATSVISDVAAQRPGRRFAPPRAEREEKLPPPAKLGEAATRAVVARYETTEHWVQKSVILLSLQNYWHPAGGAIVLEALRNRDRRLRAYAIEVLLRSESGLLPSIASAELIHELIGKQLKLNNAHYRDRVLAALSRIAPDAGAGSKSEWGRWWSKNRETWKPGKWSPPPKSDDAKGGGTVAGFVERAFDLYHSGLDVVICIDSTGSMQPTIDAARDALGQMLDILDGISPKLRMGLTHYRDLGDMSNGAKLIMPLSGNVKAVREKLSKLQAMGGGDMPERVANGLEIALSRQMRWKKNTNKLVIIIGDAPPQDLAKAEKLAKEAFEKGVGGSKVVHTGPRKKLKPIITSAISINRASASAFRAIAKAGHGAFAQINMAFGGMRRGGGRVGRAEARNSDAPQKIVEHILTLSFGSRFRREMREFVKIFYAYRGAGFFK